MKTPDKEHDQALKMHRRFSRRMLLLGVGQVGLFGLLGWRLRQLQIVESSGYRLLSDENRISLQLIAPARGTIFDRFGVPIAEDKENLRVLLIPAFCQGLAATLAAISAIAPVSSADKDRVRRAARRQSGFFPVLVRENLSWRQFALLNVLAPQYPGVRTDRGGHRHYRNGSSMAHVVGYVGMADKEEIDSDPVMRVPGFRVGKVGIEKGFDQQLRGRPGTIKYEVDAHGRIVRELGTVASESGKDLVLTVDQELQAMAQKRIEGVRAASVVALDVVTGGVLVMASNPSFDPNEIAFQADPARLRALVRENDNPFNNRAVRGLYPPGSTFKVITALAGLANGVITPEEHVRCPGSYRVGRKVFRCWRSHGSVDLHEAIKQSCDCYFYETANRLGIDRLAITCRALGLGQIYDCGLAGQKEGIVPDTAWKRRTLREQWWGGETVIHGIGQGYLTTTPLQLAVATARVATGRAVVPRFVASQGEVKPAPLLDIDPAHLAHVRAGMVGVVNEKGGTAVRSALAIPDVQMAGKTGTSQVVSLRNKHKLGWRGEHHALFIAFAPAHAPRYAAACVVEHGGGGSRAAAPVVRDVMTEILLRDPAAKPVFVSSHESEEHKAFAAAGDVR